MGLSDNAKAAILNGLTTAAKPIVLVSDHSETITHITLGGAVASKPKSLAPEDVEEWLAKDDEPQVVELTPDGPATDGTMSFNAGAITLSAD